MGFQDLIARHDQDHEMFLRPRKRTAKLAPQNHWHWKAEKNHQPNLHDVGVQNVNGRWVYQGCYIFLTFISHPGILWNRKSTCKGFINLSQRVLSCICCIWLLLLFWFNPGLTSEKIDSSRFHRLNVSELETILGSCKKRPKDSHPSCGSQEKERKQMTFAASETSWESEGIPPSHPCQERVRKPPGFP